jgi:alpha-tubulin suppressor-like RCC1 family protein
MILFGSRVVATLAMGEEFTVVLTADNALLSWGRNDMGQLGDGAASSTFLFNTSILTGAAKSSPAYVYTSGVLANKTINILKAGGKYCLVLTTGMFRFNCLPLDNKLYSWGGLNAGTYTTGDGTASTSSNVPVSVSMTAFGTKTLTKITTSATTAYALTSDGSLFGMGEATYQLVGESGPFTTFTALVFPNASLIPGETISDFNLGFSTGMFMTSIGRGLTLGDGSVGQLGNGFITVSVLPFSVPFEIKTVNNSKVLTMAASTGRKIPDTSSVTMIITDGCSYPSSAVTVIASYAMIKCDDPNKLFGFGRNNQGQLGGMLLLCITYIFKMALLRIDTIHQQRWT